MAWFRLDDQVAFHQKVLDAGNEAFGAWVRMGTWSSARRLNGKVTESAAMTIAGTRRVVERLIAVGLLDRDGDDYQVHDYLDWNPSADEVEQKRANRAAAGKRGGEQSGRSRRSKKKATSEANTEANASLVSKQNGSADEAKTNPVPVPDPDASYEASQKQKQDTQTRAPTRVDERLRTAWCAAGLPASALDSYFPSQVQQRLEDAGLDLGEACRAFKRWSDYQRSTGATNCGASPKLMLDRIDHVELVMRGEMKLEGRVGPKRGHDPGDLSRGQVPVVHLPSTKKAGQS